MEQEARRQTPLYQQIANELRSEILRLPEGATIETEQALTERYSVSRGTVRQALQKLVQEGLLVRTQGSGTVRAKNGFAEERFVVEASSFRLIKELGQACEYRDLSYTTVRATNAVADALQLPHGSKVRRIYRIRTMNGRPLAVGVTYARADLMKQMPKHPSLSSMLQYIQVERQLPHYDRRCVCSAVAASEADAAALNVEPNTPLLQFRFTASVVGVGPFLTDTFHLIPDYSFCLVACDSLQL